ncbi:M57 family metalloprotease [Chitinophaga pinensis]|uniref:Dual-action HEIGH metallo-peptidase n=1 Tax=Chitinophaga pinensis TaxID=79329 RepID=A0A5C6LTD3_9BACT|nr:M57 family metalloprotease [Chitinophaga pinensis]TWV99028.1 hypothetical protein FEF09_18405 [Chitinophaga pinensis]
MRTRIASLAVTITAMSAFLFACKKENANTQAPVTDEIQARVDEKYLQKIHDLGFDTSGVKNYDSIFVVEGDRAISRKFLDEYNIRKDANAKYATATNLWTLGNQIKVFLPSTVLGEPRYYAGAVRAIQEWNSAHSALSFYATYYATDPAYSFQIVYGTLPSGVYAMGDYPGFSNFNGVNGYQIILNKTLIDSQNLSSDQISWLIAHEIGHMMGLRHSDWNTQGEGIADNGQVIGNVDLPAFSESDAALSIMRKNFVPSTNDGYLLFNESGKDAEVIRALYPGSACNLYPHINLPASGTQATYNNIGTLYPSYRVKLNELVAVEWDIRNSANVSVATWNDSDISFHFPSNLPKGTYNVFHRVKTTTCPNPSQIVKLIQIL